MKSIFLPSLTITCHRKKHIFLRELGQCRRATQFGKQRAAEIELQRFEQRQIHQESLSFGRLARENFFSEKIKDVALVLLQEVVQVQRRGSVCRMHLLLGNLPHKLKRSYPALGSPAIFGYLFVFQLDV